MSTVQPIQKLGKCEHFIIKSLLRQKIQEWSDDLPDDDAVEAVEELIALKDKIDDHVLYISTPD